jgi:hypothetical protein
MNKKHFNLPALEFELNFLKSDLKKIVFVCDRTSEDDPNYGDLIKQRAEAIRKIWALADKISKL